MAPYLTRLFWARRCILAASRYGSTVREQKLCRAMSTFGAVSVPTLSSGLRSLNYPEKQEGTSQRKGSVYFTVDDLKVPDLPLKQVLFEKVLPVMCDTLENKRWLSLLQLQRYCCSKDTILDINVALKQEFVAMFVWFLFTGVPPHVKEGVAWALKDICSKTCDATNMDISDEGSDVHAPSKMSIDHASIDALLVDALCSKNEEVLRQVCCCLGFLAYNGDCRTVSFGNGVKKKLIQLSRECDSPAVLRYLFFAISRIGMIKEDIREKIIEAELSDCLLRKILSGEDYHNKTQNKESFSQRIWSGEYVQAITLNEEAYHMVSIILEGICNDQILEYLSKHIMPAVVGGCFCHGSNVMRIGSGVIAKFIAKAPPHYIKEVVDLGCLKVLCFMLTSSDEIIKEYSLKSVERILTFGDADPSKNEYAKMIDDINKEWKVFCVDPDSYPALADLASGIVKKYRLDIFPEWLKWQAVKKYHPDIYLKWLNWQENFDGGWC